MAVVLGTNAGFVTVAPTADPSGTSFEADTRSYAIKHITPGGMTKITEVGWWCDNITEEANFEVGLYSHHTGNNQPFIQLFSDTVNAKGTTAGWKTVSVDWDITPGTIYWIAAQLDNTATTTNQNYSAGGYYSSDSVAALPATWNQFAGAGALTFAVYAIVETGTTPVDIAGTITGISSLSGTLTLSTQVSITGIIVGVSTVGGALGAELILSSNWQTDNFSIIKRLIAIGNDSLYYEDI